MNNRGAELYSLELYQEALDSFDQAVALESNEALYWTNRGNALRQLEQLENALASYNTALLINPAYSQARYWHNIVLKALEQKNKSRLLNSISGKAQELPEPHSDKNLLATWERWFLEVDRLEPEGFKAESDEYKQALIEKYKKQGLIL